MPTGLRGKLNVFLVKIDELFVLGHGTDDGFLLCLVSAVLSEVFGRGNDAEGMAFSRGLYRKGNARAILALHATAISVFILCR
jgi:hypothetical protein